MKKIFNKKMIIILSIISTISLVGCNNNVSTNSNNNSSQDTTKQNSITNNKVETTEKIDLLSELNNAKKITVEEKFVSIGASYNIYADDKYIGEIQGKYVNITGDVFEMKDLNGNVVKSEKQIKRWNIKLNRMAEIYDKDKNISGYIGEEKIKDMFSLGYKFHFYNKNKQEIGYTNQQIFSLTDSYKVYDLNKNLDYEIKEEFISLKPSFNISINDTSDISAEDVVFYTAIQNEISKSDKKSNKKRKETKTSNRVKNVDVAKNFNLIL